MSLGAASGRAALWIAATAAFGLLQVGILGMQAFLSRSASFPGANLLETGVFLFFGAAMSVGVLLDYLFAGKSGSPVASVVAVMIPVIVVAATAVTFQVIQSTPSHDLRTSNLIWVHVAIISLTTTYSGVIKTLTFI